MIIKSLTATEVTKKKNELSEAQSWLLENEKLWLAKDF
jgi:hypothetical protein